MNAQPIMHRTILICACVMAMIVLFPVFVSASTVRMTTTAVVAYPNYKIAALMVTFSDNPAKPIADDRSGPWTKQYLNGVLFANSNSMAAYYAEESEGAVSVSGDVYDNGASWYTINRPTADGDSCNWNTFFSDVLAAADADVDFRSYNTIMVFTPQYACDSGGLATTIPNVPDTGGKAYRAAVINGILNTYPHHELGHIIGFGHANSWQCDPPGVLTGTNCRAVEYADRYGIMGSSSRMLLLPAPLKERMGWLRPSEITTAAVDGEYVINTYELANAGPKVLKIPQERDTAGNITGWYYLEYRQPVGFDNVPNTPTLQELGVPNGALVHLGPAGDDLTTTLLDMTPGSRESAHDIFEPALQVGSSCLDPVADVSFGVVSRTASSMTIRVKFGTTSLCQWKAPAVTVKALKSRAKPGQELQYKLTVKNGATLCGKQALELRTTKKPSGWTVTISKQKKKTFDLLPNESKTYVVRITSPKSAKYQKYSVNIEARFVERTILKKTVTLKPSIIRR
ncbi:MAG: NEW3 domain-containing protein [Candidatus Kerfeldbacteria bacterium]